MCILKCLGNHERKFKSEMLVVIEVSSQLIRIVFMVRFLINKVILEIVLKIVSFTK